MKLPVLFSAPLSLYTWMTPPEDVGETLLAERQGNSGVSRSLTKEEGDEDEGKLKQKCHLRTKEAATGSY